MERDDLNGRMMLSSRRDDDAIVLSIVGALRRQNLCVRTIVREQSMMLSTTSDIVVGHRQPLPSSLFQLNRDDKKKHLQMHRCIKSLVRPDCVNKSQLSR